MSSKSESQTTLAERIRAAFWEEWLESGDRPASVYRVCKAASVSEREFYEVYASLDAIESKTWGQLIEDTKSELAKDPDFDSFNARQRLLSFLFAYFDQCLDARSRMLIAFPRLRPGRRPPKNLSKFRKAFKDWADDLCKFAIENNEIADRKRLSDAYPEALFGMLWYLTDFNLRDESEGFQDTDALVEKSVRAFFDGTQTQFLDSAFDLAKFLLGRR